MLVVVPKNNESLDRALKRLKKKYQKTKLRQKVRERLFFVKKSVKRKKELEKARKRDRWLLLNG